MNTNNVIARTRLPTAKNAFPDRTYTNGSVTGMNVSRREQENRPDNENKIRGLVVDAQLLHALTVYRIREFPSLTPEEVREFCLESCIRMGLEVRL